MLYVGRNTVAPNNVINTGIEQVQSDYAQVDTTAVDYIKNKPTLASVATSGDYSDLSNTPTIPTVNDATLTITQNGTSVGTFTANASSDVTVNFTDTTYSTFTGADGVNAGSSGLVPAPTAVDNEKFLKGDGTWATVGGNSYTAGTGIDITNNEISVASPTLTNTATGNRSLAISDMFRTTGENNVNIGGYATARSGVAVGFNAQSRANYSVSIGIDSDVEGNFGIAIGEYARAFSNKSIAIGSSSYVTASATSSIQIGKGTNDEADTVKFGNDTNNWKLLDLTTGLIPDARLSSNVQTTSNLVTSVSSASTDTQYPSAKLFYDTVGNIEATLDAIIAQGSNA